MSLKVVVSVSRDRAEFCRSERDVQLGVHQRTNDI